MTTIVKCKFCKKFSTFMDQALYGFDCQHCKKFNEEDTYDRMDEA